MSFLPFKVMDSKTDSKADKLLLLSTLSTLSEKITAVVEQAKEDFKAAKDVYEFIKTENISAGICKLFIMPAYIECFKTLGVKTRKQMEQLWSKQYSDHKVRQAVEDLLENENSVEEFAAEVEKVLRSHEKKSNPCAKVGQYLPKALSLIDAETGQESSLESYWKGSKYTWFVFLRHFG